ncbi:Ig-like domain-containing protein [Collimonas fungivorans]|uniref:Putative outer membrane adhesin like protein n=1 Tax=Collimonas fungivorans (strain Ter331) TaxID=1005048 RepID=G0AB54_COLFT|nr:Ig-like domain-containing protein [Collimonas fungivorans]AEK61179.1 putative outer membrane adhesin like protein [Collimonas fungivorans Ter331]
MSSNKKKSGAWIDLDEFGPAVSMADALRSNAQSPANDMFAAVDGVAAGSTSVPADSVRKDAELEVVPVSRVAALDRPAPLPSNAVTHILDNGPLMSSAYVDQAGGWGATMAPPGSATAVELVEEAALPDITDEPSFPPVQGPERPGLPPVIEQAFDTFGRTGVVANGGATDDVAPLFSGQAEPFTQLMIFDNGVHLGDATTGQDGQWRFNVIEPLAQGEHVFTVAGAGLTSAPFTLTIGAPDSARPVIDLVLDNIGATAQLASGDTTDDARPAFHGRGEPGTLLEIYDHGVLVGSLPVGLDGRWSYTDHFDRLSPGEHVFTLVGAGVASEPFVLHVANVPAAPAPVIDSVVGQAGDIASGAVTDDNRPVFNGRGEPDVLVRLYDGELYLGAAIADENGNWTFQPGEHAPLSDGEHVFTAATGGDSSALFVLHIATSTAEGEALALPAAEEGLGSLVLADLLQPPAKELLADQKSGDVVDTCFVKNAIADGVVLPVAMPAELWLQDAAPAMT